MGPQALTNQFTSHFEGFKVGIVPLDKIERLNPMRTDTTQGVDEIAEALASGDRSGHLRRPVGVIPGQKPGHYELIFGFRRVRAMRRLGHQDCKAVIFNLREIAEGTRYIPEDFLELTVVERCLLADALVRRYYANYVGSNEGREIVPKLLGLGSKTVFRYCLNAIRTLDRRLLDRFDAGQLNFTLANDLSNLPPDEQAKIATGELPMPSPQERRPRKMAPRPVKAEPSKAIQKLRGKSKSCLTLIEQIDELMGSVRSLRSSMQKTGGDLGTHIIDLPELDKKLALANTLFSQVRVFVRGQ